MSIDQAGLEFVARSAAQASRDASEGVDSNDGSYLIGASEALEQILQDLIRHGDPSIGFSEATREAEKLIAEAHARLAGAS